MWLVVALLTTFDVVTPFSNFESEIFKFESRALNFVTEVLRFETVSSSFESELRVVTPFIHPAEARVTG